MADHRIVQCFGTKVRPHKEAKPCRRRFLWTSKAGGQTRFGRRGCQACPHCGTLPDLSHPFNRYLDGELSEERAKEMMPGFIEQLEKAKAGK